MDQISRWKLPTTDRLFGCLVVLQWTDKTWTVEANTAPGRPSVPTVKRTDAILFLPSLSNATLSARKKEAVTVTTQLGKCLL